MNTETTNGATTPTKDTTNGAAAHDATDDDPPRARWYVQAPGWLPSFAPATPADIDGDTDPDDAARMLLLHLAEARACMERLYGFWVDRDESYPGDAEVAALVARHAYACHNVTTHIEMAHRDHMKAAKKGRPAPAKAETAKTDRPAPKDEIPALEEKTQEAILTMSTIREAVDTIYASRQPIDERDYANLCNLTHIGDEELWTISSMAKDHSCEVHPKKTDGAS